MGGEDRWGGGEGRVGEGRGAKILHTYIQIYIQTYAAGCRGAFAPKN